MMPGNDWRTNSTRLLGTLASLILLATLHGCAHPEAPPNLPRLFVSEPFDASEPAAFDIDPDSKYALFEPELCDHDGALPRMDHRDYAMLAANRSMIRLALGSIADARTDALNAQAVMTGDVRGEQGKAVTAALADESAKVFKGECYEIAMLNSVVGLCSLQLGDPETAGIAFRRALEADKMSKEEGADDFTLAYWGLGMAYLDDDPEAARQALTRCGYKDIETIKDENLVFVIGIGNAPWKRLVGLYGEQDAITPCFCEPSYAEVFVDDQSLGRSFCLIDLSQQAKGVRRSGKDVGQGVKAGGKFLLATVAGAFLGDAGSSLVESGWSIKADTRTCYMLPDEIHVVSGRVTPGLHTINVKFYNASGAHLQRYEQVWHYVAAPEAGRSYVNLRAEFDLCNVQGPVPFTPITRVKSRKVPIADAAEDDQQSPQEKEEITLKFQADHLQPLAPGDTVTLCHPYTHTQHRMDNTYHWRQHPIIYNNKGQPLGYPDCRLRMDDYDIGVVGEAEVARIKGRTAIATVRSLTTEYKPRAGDWVTTARKVGRLWN